MGAFDDVYTHGLTPLSLPPSLPPSHLRSHPPSFPPSLPPSLPSSLPPSLPLSLPLSLLELISTVAVAFVPSHVSTGSTAAGASDQYVGDTELDDMRDGYECIPAALHGKMLLFIWEIQHNH